MNRIYHTWDKWECYPAGFYEGSMKGMKDAECRESYAAFLGDSQRFRRALERLIAEWPYSCEHYLTNGSMNRIAWLGQAAACIEMGIPARFRAGYFLLTREQQGEADIVALEYLNKWLTDHGYEVVDLDGAGVRAQVNLY